MKKSQLRKLIRESIKGLMTEQTTSPGVWVKFKECAQVTLAGSYTICFPTSGGAPTLGSTYIMTQTVNAPFEGVKGFVHDIAGVCNSFQNSMQMIATPVPVGSCPSCCPGNVQGAGNNMSVWGLPPVYGATGWWNGAFTFPSAQGACTLNCGTTSAGSCNPAAWSNHANWTSNFTNTVNTLAANPNPNQPCTFLNGKIAQWTAALQGTGQGGYQNMLNCKLDLANQLHTQNNC